MHEGVGYSLSSFLQEQYHRCFGDGCPSHFLFYTNINVSHQVVDEHNTVVAPDCSSRVHIVKAEWFWASVQNEEAQDESDYLFKDVSKFIFLLYASRTAHLNRSVTTFCCW